MINANDYCLWTTTKNPIENDLFQVIDKNISKIKNQSTLLHGDNNNINQTTSKKHSELNNFSNRKHLQYPHISHSMRKALISLNKKINVIKHTTNTINRNNNFYLDELLHKNKEDKHSECETLETMRYIIGEKKPKCSSTNVSPLNNQSKTIIRNFSYVNNKFRKQLSKAFFQFNPITHRNNIQLMSQLDSSIKKDISQLKEVVDKNIATITDRRYYRNKYETIKKKHEKERLMMLDISDELTPQKQLIKNSSAPCLKNASPRRSTLMHRRQTYILNKLHLPIELKKKRISLKERKLNESKFYLNLFFSENVNECC